MVILKVRNLGVSWFWDPLLPNCSLLVHLGVMIIKCGLLGDLGLLERRGRLRLEYLLR